jgi:quercetin dioxygenase-like cupin family protein
MRRILKSKRWLVCALGVALGLTALTRAALATPPSGVLSGAILARGLFLVPVDMKFKVDNGHPEVIHVPDTRETVMQDILLAPNGRTGWHSHPGPALAVIKSGALTLFADDGGTCTSQTYPAGTAFLEHGQGHVHLGVNLSASENTEVVVTYFDVPPGGSVRTDESAPAACQ